MAAPSGNMADGLNKMLADVAKLAAVPDADLDFLIKLQMIITDYLRSGGGENSQQQSQQMAPQPPGAGMAQQGTGQMGGAMMGMGMPNPDELRRMMSTQSGGQGG